MVALLDLKLVSSKLDHMMLMAINVITTHRNLMTKLGRIIIKRVKGTMRISTNMLKITQGRATRKHKDRQDSRALMGSTKLGHQLLSSQRKAPIISKDKVSSVEFLE